MESNKMSMESPAEIENQIHGSQQIAQEPHSNQLVTQRYNFRSRENLNVPARYRDDQKQKNDEAIDKLKRKRSGKKSIITMKINQINKLIEEHGSRTKLKFLHGKLLEAQSEVTDLHEQLMEEMAPDDPLFNDDWIAEVNIAVDECSSEVNEYLLSRANDPPSDVMSTTAWLEDYLEKSEKHVIETEPLSDLATQLHQLTITSNQQVVHADVHDRKEAVKARKPSGAYNQLQNAVETLEKQRDGEYRGTLSAEAQPFVTFQASKDKFNYFNKDKQKKVRSRNTITMNLPDNYSACKGEEELSADAWIDQLSVHDRERTVQSTSMDHLSVTWLLQQNLPRIQVPIYDGSPTKWLEFAVKFKDLVHDLQFLTNTQRMTYLLQHLEGEAKRAVQCFSNDKVGYIMALKRLKYTFGQKPQICQAYIQKMIRGKQIGNDDKKTLMEYYYTISDCIVALSQLNYTTDLFSSDIRRQVIRRLPPKFHGKWGELCFTLRTVKEPTLVDFENWLQDRILAFKEAYLPVQHELKNN